MNTGCGRGRDLRSRPGRGVYDHNVARTARPEVDATKRSQYDHFVTRLPPEAFGATLGSRNVESGWVEFAGPKY
jgi:hypothetical protein